MTFRGIGVLNLGLPMKKAMEWKSE